MTKTAAYPFLSLWAMMMTIKFCFPGATTACLFLFASISLLLLLWMSSSLLVVILSGSFQAAIVPKELFWSDTQAVLSEMAALCVVVINEEAYLNEWVDHHAALGFLNIYCHLTIVWTIIYNSGVLTKKKKVTVEHYPGRGKQGVAYLNCAKKPKRSTHGHFL